MSDHPTRSKRSSQKLRQTNENLIISEIQSLNTRVAELLEQFGLLTMEIVNVADDLERQQIGTDEIQDEIKAIKEQFVELGDALKDTQKKVGILERKLEAIEQRGLNNLGTTTTTYHKKGEDNNGE